MLRSRLLRWAVVLLVMAVGVTMVAVAGPGGPFGSRPAVSPPPQPGRPVTPMSEVDPAAAADEAKGVYEGPLGDFLVTPQEAAAAPCSERVRRTQDFKTSELYSPVFGEDPWAYECDGKVVMILTGSEVGRRYFIGPAKVPYRGPFGRLALLTVGGYPAIAQLPHPSFPNSLRLAVIERFPSKSEPGILVAIDNSASLEEAIGLAARIMGVRP